MKIYTEEQLKQLLNTVVEDMTDLKFNELLNESEIVSIELPSKDEIENGYEPKTMYDLGYLDGKKWMLDKIQGGNK